MVLDTAGNDATYWQRRVTTARERLQQAQALKQVEQEIDAAKAVLQAVQQEALQAGAPQAWLQ